jgi:hypothetical protein
MPRRCSGMRRVVILPEPVDAACDAYLRAVDELSPGLVIGLYLHGSLCWGEFFHGSDIDFVSVLARRPDDTDLAALEQTQVATSTTEVNFDGFHCVGDDLAGPPGSCPPVPAYREGRFETRGRPDVNPVTWHELAERGIVVRGVGSDLSGVHTDSQHLLAFTRDNLDTYWRQQSALLDAASDEEIGAVPDATTWNVLGVARLHHLLATHRLTSKSGAGRYVVGRLSDRWHRIGREALRLRERPERRSLYAHPAERGADTRGFVAWAIADGLSPTGPLAYGRG